MNRPPNPDRGPMSVAVFAFVVAALVACGLARIVTAPWAQMFADMVR